MEQYADAAIVLGGAYIVLILLLPVVSFILYFFGKYLVMILIGVWATRSLGLSSEIAGVFVALVIITYWIKQGIEEEERIQAEK